MPDTSAYLYRRDRFQTKWDKNKQGKQTYVDVIFNNSKRKEKSVPASNAYNPDRIKVELPSTVQQKWNHEKRVTNIDHIMISEKKKVGPNAYNTEQTQKEKIYGVYLGQNKQPK